MDKYNEEFLIEEKYLNETINLIEEKLAYEKSELSDKKADLISARKEMWENTTHTSSDFDKVTEANQYLSALESQNISYADTERRVLRYEKILTAPYFARIDFTEDGYDDTEKIYIGLFNLMDEDTHNIRIYDWRAPISGLYYRYEPGPVSYTAPAGDVYGRIDLKRQYKISKGKLEYFFDSNINIVDDMLQEALSKNTSVQMKTIVETIQRQQDLIIRDLHNELLVVQGVAGSGKTSVALHRIAYLLYQGINSKLSSNNVIIISPNNLFSKYISHVLPELGEENISEMTFENIFQYVFDNNVSIRNKSEQLEQQICSSKEKTREFLLSCTEFKGSSLFVEILNRYIKYFEHKIIVFKDIYYDNKYVATRQDMKALLLSKKLNMPTAKKLKIIEGRIIDSIHELNHSRRQKIETVVGNSNKHQFEVKAFTRVLAAKETKRLLDIIHTFTEFDVFEVYKKLFQDKNVFYTVAKGLTLPDNIEDIIDYTNKKLDPYNIQYDDGIAMLYLKTQAEGLDLYKNIRQVVIDEAQDYYPIHYEILKSIFREARFTIVGDVNQAIEKTADLTIYDDIISIFNKNKSAKLLLTKSYRSSYEIGLFSSQLLDSDTGTEMFQRHESSPIITTSATEDEMNSKLIEDIKSYEAEGMKSIAIICKSKKEASSVYFKLKSQINMSLIDNNSDSITDGIVILPVYMAKGLEFDAVLVYNVSRENYNTKFDKKLLYIACTRPLHKLSLYCKGNLTKFIK